MQTNAIQPIVAPSFPSKSPVDREQARMLVTSIGFGEASKRLGVSIWTLYQWNHRFGWKLKPSHSQAVKSVKTPSVAQAESIADTGREIRSHLARIALASAKRTKRVPLRTMKDLRDAASATQIVDPQGEERSLITLNVLNVNGDMHTRD